MRGAKPWGDGGSLSPLDNVPEAPDWLSPDALAEWNRVAPVLASERRTLTSADEASLASYCTAVGQIAECSRVIAREGMTYQSKTGPKKHPAIAIRDAAMTQARLLASELGLTPVSRARGGRSGAGAGDMQQGGLFDPGFFNGGH